MKILFPLLLLVFFSGCDPAPKEESIEMMSYQYEWIADKMVPNYILYATIHPDGRMEILRKKDKLGNDMTSYASVINKKTVDSIFELASRFPEAYYRPIYDTTAIRLCDAPIIRIKISTPENKEYSINFSPCENEKKYAFYVNFYMQLHEISSRENIKIEEREVLLQKQKLYEKFVVHRDSTQLPFPSPPRPVPKIDEVKFVKPQ